jgi:hypothetical protein
MKRFFTRHWGKVTIAAILIFIAFWKGCEVTDKEPVKFIPVPKIDTVPGNFEVKKVVPNVVPEVKKVYKKKDKPLRDSAEKKDIILTVDIKEGEIDITKIDTLGQVTTEIIPLAVVLPEETKEITIAPEGVQEKEKTKAGKVLQKVGKGLKKAGKGIVIGLAVVGAVAIAIVASGG